jgi:hypothetical protein
VTRSKESISTDLLRFVAKFGPDELVCGTASAREVAGLISENFSSCPRCGAEPWVNIDCPLCLFMGELERDL